MEKKFIWNNITTFYHDYGKGQPVVLLHGFGEDSTIYDKQVEALKDHCRLIVPDIPGSGKSQLIEKDDISIEDYAEWLLALIKFEKLPPITLLGHSMGGYITLAFAEKNPQFISAFGLIHSTAFADNAQKKETRTKAIDFIQKNGTYAFLKTSIPNLFGEQFKKQHYDEIERLIEKGRNFSEAALVQYYKVMLKRPDRTEVLKQSDKPVLFIIGSEDAAAPLDDLLQQIHHPTFSYIHIIDGVGHMSMLEEPETLNRQLLNFITR